MPGLIHEFRNILSRINLLTEMRSDSEGMMQIRGETRSKDFRFLCDLTRTLSISEGLDYLTQMPPGEAGRIELPRHIEPFLRVLRASARSLNVRFVYSKKGDAEMYADRTHICIAIARAVYAACSAEPRPGELNLVFSERDSAFVADLYSDGGRALEIELA